MKELPDLHRTSTGWSVRFAVEVKLQNNASTELYDWLVAATSSRSIKSKHGANFRKMTGSKVGEVVIAKLELLLGNW